MLINYILEFVPLIMEFIRSKTQAYHLICEFVQFNLKNDSKEILILILSNKNYDINWDIKTNTMIYD